jgi:hypothetical protein
MPARTRLAQLIGQEEGFGRAGVLPTIRHNPGDLRHSPHSEHPGGPAHADDIGTIDDDTDGWNDLERQLEIDAGEGAQYGFNVPEMTLGQAIFTWAPEGDGDNNPSKYLADIIEGFHGQFSAETPLSQVLQVGAI